MRITAARLRRTATVLVVSVLLIASAAGWVAWTESGTAFVARRLLATYNDWVPGSIQVEQLSGSLLGGLTLDGVILADRAARPLIEVKRVILKLEPTSLWDGEIHAHNIRLEGPRIYLRTYEDESAFVDLGPKSETPEPDSGPFETLALPLSFIVDHLRLLDAHIYRNDTVEGAPSELVVADEIQLYGEWSGGDAQFRIQDVRAEMPEQNLALSHFSGTAVLTDGVHARLENGRAETNRGTVIFEEVGYDIDAANGRVRLGFNTAADRFADLFQLPGELKTVEGRAALTLSAGEALSATAKVYRGNLLLSGSADASLKKLPAVAGAFSIQRADPMDFGAPVTATIGGDGTFDLSMDEDGNLLMTAAFEGKDCNLYPAGPLTLLAEARLEAGAARASLKISGRDTDVTADGSRSAEGEMSLAWRVHAKRLRSFASLSPVKRPSGKLMSEGRCGATEGKVSCDYVLDANNLRATDVSAQRLKSRGAFEFGDGAISAEGKLQLEEVRLFGVSFDTLDLDIRRIPSGASVALAGTDRGNRTVRVNGNVTATAEGYRILLERLESNVFGQSLTLLSPARIALTERGVALDDAGAPFAVSDGTITLFGAVEDKRFRKARVEVENLDLSMPAERFNLGDVRGRMDLSVTAEGRLRNPTVAFSGASGRLAIFGTAPLKLRAEGRLENGEAKLQLTATEKTAERVLLSAEAQGGVQVNLETASVIFPEHPSDFSFSVHGVTPERLAPFVSLPPDLDFSLDAHGEGIYRSLEEMSLKGHLLGTVTHPVTGTIRPELTFDILPKHQALRFKLQGDKGPAVAGTVRAAVSIPAAAQGELSMEASEAELTAGDASVSVQVDYLDAARGRVRAQFAAFDTALVAPYIPKLPVSGILSGSVIAEREGETPRLTTDVRAREFYIGEVYLGAWSAGLDWHDGTVAVEADLRQKGRTVLTASAEIPVSIDKDTRVPSWHPEKPHRIEWRLDALDYQALAPMLRLKTMGTSALDGKGRFKGSVRQVSGAAELHAVLTHPTLGDIPVDIFVDSGSAGARFRIHMIEGRSAAADLSLSSKIDWDALRLGTLSYRDLPIRGSFEMKQLNLAAFNVLDLAPLYDIRGIASCAVQVSGSRMHPKIAGQAKLRDGAFSLSGLEDPVTGVNAELLFSEDRITLKKLTAKSPRGTAAAAANGVFSPKGDLLLRAVIKAREFRIGYESLPVFLLSTDTDLTLHLNPDAARIDLLLKKTVVQHISEDNLRMKKVMLNANTTVIDSTEEKAQTKPKTREGRPVRFTVKTSDPLKITGAALDTRWKVDIDTLFHNRGVRIGGDAVLTKGSFDLFANTFVVEEAGAFFAEESGLDPHIQLTSAATLPDAKVFLRVEGTVSSPRLQLYSEPALPQEAILSLLISGSSDENVSGASIIANVIQMRYPVVTNILQNKLGFDRVSVGSAPSGNGTVVKLGKRLNDKLFFYTSFNLNADVDENDYALNFEYDIVDNVTLDTMTGNQVSSLDLSWRVPLKKKKHKRKKQEILPDK